MPGDGRRRTAAARSRARVFPPGGRPRHRRRLRLPRLRGARAAWTLRLRRLERRLADGTANAARLTARERPRTRERGGVGVAAADPRGAARPLRDRPRRGRCWRAVRDDARARRDRSACRAPSTGSRRLSDGRSVAARRNPGRTGRARRRARRGRFRLGWIAIGSTSRSKASGHASLHSLGRSSVRRPPKTPSRTPMSSVVRPSVSFGTRPPSRGGSSASA